ncbi:hypothetical protein [Arthrobacter sp. NIO-1057]|uniref:hypothetical protein n=1 Tax=Arthrobacter sp. NIO-1057 TaxID=993071 RepID=UPI00071D83DC|nr:hypothetical protein [Arthrobacter sp. NIO-1057]KSU68158.1 hypothetical protein AS038_03465 [Arthrobacter sp. NIO-1057]SCB90261.1 hypothetical protein GA0061084_0704 [Arthrobacter sp. NIO-1057]
MNGFQLRLVGACILLFVLIGLLSGWSALFAADALLSTLLQAGLLILGLALVYQGENLGAAQRNS